MQRFHSHLRVCQQADPSPRAVGAPDFRPRSRRFSEMRGALRRRESDGGGAPSLPAPTIRSPLENAFHTKRKTAGFLRTRLSC